MKKGKIMGNVLLVIIAGIILLVLILLMTRQIRILQVKEDIKITTENGIEEELNLEINGVKQYVNIRGEDINNPIIIMVHGGMPMTPVLHTYQQLWEKNYTIINSDRRGTGETYFLNEKSDEQLMEELTPEQYIADLKELVSYAQKRFHKDKVIIVADSFGTLYASRFVLTYPELVEAYVGSAQVVNLKDDMELCTQDIMEKAKKSGDSKCVQKLEQLNWNFDDSKNWMEINQTLASYVGKYISEDAQENMMGNIMAGMQSPYFPLSHLKYYFISDKLQISNNEYLAHVDIKDYGTKYEVPVIFAYGSEDWITRYTIKDYYELIQAPQKRLIIIEHAGHDALQTSAGDFYTQVNEALCEFCNQ